MNYVLLNHEILVSDGKNVRRIDKADSGPTFASMDAVSLCVVDVDVLLAASVESPIEKKDSILVRKFKEFYQKEPYIIQDEKIDTNLFQVIGIKEQKVREIYSLIDPQKVICFVPYAMALRNTLTRKGIDLNRTVVFVDVGRHEKLLTVFDGLKFSRTRLIDHHEEDILPEIRRSRIDFFKKTEAFLVKKSADFVMVVNNPKLFSELGLNPDKIPVEYLDVPHPALEGLKDLNTSLKYRQPEEDIKKRQEAEIRQKIATGLTALALVAGGFFYWMFYKVQWHTYDNRWRVVQQVHERLSQQIRNLDQNTYRQDIKRSLMNYALFYLSMLDLVPTSYTVEAFRLYRSHRWHMELTLLAYEEGPLDTIPRLNLLKNADIKDIFINNQPGKHVSITL